MEEAFLRDLVRVRCSTLERLRVIKVRSNGEELEEGKEFKCLESTVVRVTRWKGAADLKVERGDRGDEEFGGVVYRI